MLNLPNVMSNNESVYQSSICVKITDFSSVPWGDLIEQIKKSVIYSSKKFRNSLFEAHDLSPVRKKVKHVPLQFSPSENFRETFFQKCIISLSKFNESFDKW